MKKEKVKNVMLIILVLVLAFAMYKIFFQQEKDNQKEPIKMIVLPDTSGTKIFQPAPVTDPCAQITNLTEALNQAKKELIEAENKVETAELDLQTAIKKCQIQNGITEEPVVKKAPTKKAPTQTKPNAKTKEPTPTTSLQTSSGQVSAATITYENPPSHQSVTRTMGSQIMCLNINDMSPGRYYPQLIIDAGGTVEGAILNKDGDGHNLTYTPIDNHLAPAGLWGGYKDGRQFVKASEIDHLGPTIVKIGGGPLGWVNWRTARLIGEYYITE